MDIIVLKILDQFSFKDKDYKIYLCYRKKYNVLVAETHIVNKNYNVVTGLYDGFQYYNTQLPIKYYHNFLECYLLKENDKAWINIFHHYLLPYYFLF